MGRLILINGAPATGKSTLARRYADEHPLTLVLDIDRVRSMLGRWPEAPVEAGKLARALALEMARVHLTAGHDVLVPQLLGQLPYVEELDRLARETRTHFVEIALLATSRAEAAARFHRRSDRDERPSHRDAQVLAQQSPDVGQLLADYYDAVLGVVENRPGTHTLTTVDGQLDQAYAALLSCLDATH